MSKSKKVGKVENPFEHALKRPDTYIGSAKTKVLERYIFDEKKSAIVPKNINFNRGLFNINREIGSNGIDNKWRSEEDKDTPNMTYIHIRINSKKGQISFENDGASIPVMKATYKYKDYRSGKTRKEKLYPAEIFFGDMLAGTNFENDSNRKTSGKNGMGAKATNIFSTEFIVEHTSPDDKKSFKQVYTCNGKKRTTPEIGSYTRKKGYTKITFTPDYKRFAYPSAEKPGMDSDLISVIKTYAYEIAMVTGIRVIFEVDGESETIKVSSLEKYARLFFPNVTTHKTVSFKAKSGDECVLIDTGESEYSELEQITSFSYVNGIRTAKGGIHLDSWRDAIIPAFVRMFNARKPKKGEPHLKTSAKQVYPYLLLFVRTEMNVMPEFDSQTKDCLEGPEYHIYKKGSKTEKADFSRQLEANIKKMMKFSFVELLEEKLLAKIDRKLASKAGKKVARVKSEKLRDANEAGKKRASECILWVTEGDSAKTLVVSGINCIKDGSDLNGAYPIRGKFPNAQNMSRRDMMANKEAQELMKIIGLVPGADYSKDKLYDTLRYGKIMIAADVDDDGIHIRGLMINFIYKFWPELIGREFICSFSTAVVRAWMKPLPGSKLPKGIKKEMLFWSNPEYAAFKIKYCDPENPRLEIVDDKYYKGLGTIEPVNVPEFFEHQKYVKYYLEGDEAEYMELGFHKNASDQRKEWLTRGRINPVVKALDLDEEEMVGEEGDDFVPDFVYKGKLGVSTFVDHQLIIYHRMSLRRALPHVMDGFKESQRKAFFGIRLKKYKKPAKVSTVAGAVQELTAYHHGDSSGQGTIVKMAQGFVGRGNIPLLQNAGQYGSRLQGGKDASAARYIFTNIEDIAHAIFLSDDDPILKRLVDDNIEIEFEHFAPILPMILINGGSGKGANGIACGFSSNIPCYNPADIVRWIRMYLEDPDSVNDLEPMVPWYRGFTGEITLGSRKQKGKEYRYWTSRGILEKDKRRKNIWHVRELPIGLWTDTFKEHLDIMVDGGTDKKKQPKRLRGYKEYNTLNTVHFELNSKPDFTPDIDTPRNLSNMKSNASLMNMVALVGENDYPVRFESPEQIMKYFCSERLPIYAKRRKYLLQKYKKDLMKAQNKYNYIKYINDGTLILKQSNEAVDKAMTKLKLDKIMTKKEHTSPSYDYLLDMATRSLTEKRMEALKKEVEKVKKQIKTTKKTTPNKMWLKDLDNFEKAHKTFLRTRIEEKRRERKGRNGRNDK